MLKECRLSWLQQMVILLRSVVWKLRREETMGQGLRPKGLAQCQLEVTIGYET